MTDQNYEPIIRDMTWSYSRIETFVSCPYKFYLQYICYPKPDEEEMFYSSYGTWCHELIADYYMGDLRKNELASAFLFGFNSHVKGRRPAASTVEKWIDTGFEAFRNFNDFQMETLGVEEKFQFELGKNKYRFVGILDYIGRKDKLIYIIDNKSADIKPRSKRATPTVKDRELDEKLRQLYIYSTPVKDAYGKFPDKLCFNCFRFNRLVEEDFDLETYNKVVQWVENRIEEIARCDSFNPNCDYFYCNYICGYKRHCCYAEDFF